MKSTRMIRWFSLVALSPFALTAQTLQEGLALYQKAQFAEAKQVFESVLKQDGGNAEAHYRLGMIMMSRSFRDEDKAVEHMERAVELAPQNADYHYGLGAAYGIKAQNAGFLKKALLAPKVKREFERTIELNPAHIDAHVGLAQYYRQAPGIMGGDTEKAWEEADIVIRLDEVRGRSFKAGLYAADKKMAEAEREIRTLTSNRPKDGAAWRAAGFFYLRNDRPDDAVAAFEKYTDIRPDTVDSYSLLARAYIQKKDPDNALAAAKKCLELDRGSISAIWSQAQAFELKGQKAEARDNFQRLLSADLSESQRKTIEQKIKELQ